MNFDFASGAFVCAECGVGVAASESTYLTVRAASGLSGERSAEGIRRTLRLLRAYLNSQAEVDLPTMGELSAQIFT